jgi:hypothetical protein
MVKSGYSSIVGAAIALALGSMPAGAASLPVNVSGYELLLGTSCTIFGERGTCGVAFSGWTGGLGQKPNGWTHFPGTGQGLWKASANYLGSAGFGLSVHVVGGKFDLLFTDGTVVQGNVGSGTITWPAEGAGIGCGIDVAKISVSIGFTHGVAGSGSFEGCLHDLPAGTVIPPKIWGALQQ